MLKDVREQDKPDNKTSSNDDYGFWYPVELVKAYYWQRRNSSSMFYPEPGGWLDQDARFQEDYGTYAWLVGMAENIVKKEKADIELARQAQRGIR